MTTASWSMMARLGILTLHYIKCISVVFVKKKCVQLWHTMSKKTFSCLCINVFFSIMYTKMLEITVTSLRKQNMIKVVFTLSNFKIIICVMKANTYINIKQKAITFHLYLFILSKMTVFSYNQITDNFFKIFIPRI